MKARGGYIVLFLILCLGYLMAVSRAQKVLNPSDTAESHLRKAETYLQQDQLDKAERELRELLALESGRAGLPELSYLSAAHRNLGFIYLRQKKKSAALSAFQKSLSLEPSQPSLHYQLGLLFLGNKEYSLSAQHLEQARAGGLKNVGVLLNLARAEFAIGRTSQALSRIDEIATMNPKDASVPYQVGILLFEKLFYERARQMFQTAKGLDGNSYDITFYLALVNFLLEKYEAARDLLEELVKRHLSTVDLYSLLGSVYAKLDQFESAIATLQIAKRLDPNRADSYFNLALVYLEMKQVDRTEEILEEAARITARKEVKVFYTLSRASCEGLDKQEVARAGLNSDSTKADYYFNLATLFQNRYHHTTALELLKIMRRYEPDSARLYFALGLSCFNLQPSSPEASQMFRKAIQLQPNLEKAHYFLGEAYSRLGDYAKAAAAYRSAIQLNSQSYLSYYCLAKALAAESNGEEAAKMLVKAIQLNPVHAPSFYEWGKLHMKMGETEKAIDKLEKAVAIEPDFFEPYYHLGRALAKTGRTEKAKECFEIFEARKKIAAERATAKGGFTRADR